jgi:hypothetical protein
MTTLATQPVDEPDLLSLIADPYTPLGAPFSAKFRSACQRVASRHGGWVDPNAVREELMDEPDYEPRRYAAQWAGACGRDGFLVKTDVLVPIRGEGSKGNGNKSVPLRKWVG